MAYKFGMFVIKAFAILFITWGASASEFLPVSKVHPFSQESFEKIAYGKEYKDRSWRYRFLKRVITLYNIEQKEERLYNAPRFHENCHDSGDRFANWAYAESFTRSISVGVDFELLGLGFGVSGDFSQSFDFSFERWVHAKKGVEAIHTPYMVSETYSGKSYLQVINLTTGESYNTPLNNEDFMMNYVNPMVVVKREILSRCE